jgi:hypothetical protein
MSTTPPTLLQTLEPQWVKTYAAFIKAHHTLFIILALAAFAFFGYSKAISAWDAHEQRQDAVAQQKVTADATANQQLQAQLTTQKANFDAALKASQAQVTLLLTQLKVRQAQDDQLPLPDLGNRWSTLLNLPAGAITATPDNKLALTPEASHATVNALEELPVVQNELTLSAANLAGCQQVAAQQDKVIAGLNTQLTDTNAARVADQKLAKVEQKKSWLRGFKVGVIVGFFGGLFAHKI